jgi:uroporphyrin-III C-methyltransferase / precorrin-2 dehydrogenase / sirohydrochlorin ferrochelatase
MARHFPIFLDLAGRRALVIGIGAEAERKAMLLEQAGAELLRLPTLAEAPPSLDGIALVIIAASPDANVEALSCACRDRGIPVNVVDAPRLSSFIMPAIIDRAPVTVAISTGGAAPMLAKLLRESLEQILPLELGDLAAWAGRLRPVVRLNIPDAAQRRRFWATIFARPLAQWRRDAATDTLPRDAA